MSQTVLTCAAVKDGYATRGDKRTLSTYVDAIMDAVAIYQATTIPRNNYDQKGGGCSGSCCPRGGAAIKQANASERDERK
jgi:hypothetical protein